MKRILCMKHAHHSKGKTRQIILDNDKCTVCRWENRPMTLKDLARELEHIADSARYAAEDEYYDPFGYTWAHPLEDLFIEYLSMIHKDYRRNALNRINEKFKESQSETK